MAHQLIKQFVEVRQALKAYGIAGFGDVLILHQQVFGNIYAVLVHKIGKGDIGLAFKIPAKGCSSKVHLAGDHIHIGFSVVIGIYILINSTHAYLIFQEKLQADVAGVQDSKLVRLGKDVEHPHQFYQLLKRIRPASAFSFSVTMAFVSPWNATPQAAFLNNWLITANSGDVPMALPKKPSRSWITIWW